MIYYLVPLSIFYFGIALSVSYGGTSKAVLFITSMPLILLVCLRGHAGTDTASYYSAFTNPDSFRVYGGEPLFGLLAAFLWDIWADPRFVVNGISLATAVLLIWGIAGTRYGAWFGGLLLVPAMFFELTMNLMRFGLASSIFLLATQVPMNRKPVRYLILAIVATGMHFSAALLFILFVAITQRPQRVWVVLLMILAVAGTLVMPGYLENKGDMYEEMVAPSVTSGLALLMMQALMIGAILRFRRDFDIPNVGLGLCALVALGAYATTQFTYAGIRFQMIGVYLLAVVMLRQYAPASGRVSHGLAMWLLVIGLLGLAGRLHNMVDEAGQGRSPFLPYRTMPALQDYY
ncbi:EpsG family protein [Paraburkholderia fungorum]|uniref:EpsG family protein n=1 Tax=Paraburkholderia fungorum TaxID=134537 RepID=A0A1H1HGA4_9BURK|nr:EpsG family protein [Paraburkholderia fungorum]SDR24208.1 EpsG family protein [Paraburkholderia fungorum]